MCADGCNKSDVERLGAFERRAEGRLGDESVLHVDARAVFVHPAVVGFGVMLDDRKAVSAMQVHSAWEAAAIVPQRWGGSGGTEERILTARSGGNSWPGSGTLYWPSFVQSWSLNGRKREQRRH